jgi:hypothetical protein
MHQVCDNKDFFVVQAKIIHNAIDEDKWYLSEQEYHDVGWDVAEKHFLLTYFSGFAAGFRASYCSLVCPFRQDCLQAERWK